MKFYPDEKEGGCTSLNHAKCGVQQVLVVFTQELDVLALPKGAEGVSFHHFRGGRHTFLPSLEEGGTQKVSDSQFSLFLAPPPCPMINDRSLLKVGRIGHS